MDAGQGRPGSSAFIAAALVGAVAVAFAPTPVPVAVGVGAGMLALLARAMLRGGVLGHAAMLVFAVACGAAWTGVHAQRAVTAFLPIEAEGVEAVIEGRIVGLPLHGPSGLVATLEVESADGPWPAAAAALVGRRVELRWFRDGEGVQAGRRGRWTVGLHRPPPSRGPGLDDAARRAAVDGVVAIARVRGGSPALDLGEARGLGAAIDRWREAVSTTLVDCLGPVRARYVRALSIGDTRGLVEQDWTLLRQFGLTHLIAISGFHVALVALVGVAVVRVAWWLAPGAARRCPRPIAAAWGAFGVAAVYAVLAGASLPTVRTALMIGIVAIVATRRWRVGPLQPLALAVGIVLAVDPLAVMTPGFWLSCGGVALLVWGCGPTGRPVPGFLRAQWVASLGLLPVLAAAFLAVPGLGPLANLVAIPWISLGVVPLAVAGVAASALGADPWAALCWQAAAGLMSMLEGALRTVPADLAMMWPVSPPSPLVLGAAALGLGWVLMPRGTPFRLAGLLLLVPMLWPASSRPAMGDLEVWVFDLPRGDAVLLRSADHDVLVDAGPEGAGLPRALQTLGVRRIDLWVQTRGNAGRAGGAARVLEGLEVREHWLPPGRSGGRVALEGRTWSVEGVSVEVLHPHVDFPTGDTEASAVLVARGPAGQILLASDAGAWIASRVARGGLSPRLLLAGAPALAGWSPRFPAAVAVATRAPGPAAARRWPPDRPHPGQGGTLRVRLSADGALEIRAWRDLQPRWWDGR